MFSDVIATLNHKNGTFGMVIDRRHLLFFPQKKGIYPLNQIYTL